MTVGLQIVLLFFAGIGFAGMGAALAVSSGRRLAEGDHDVGMLGVAAMLGLFGFLCTTISAGIAGVVAFGGVVAWAAYVLMSQNLGLFSIESGDMVHEEETTRSAWEA